MATTTVVQPLRVNDGVCWEEAVKVSCAKQCVQRSTNTGFFSYTIYNRSKDHRASE